MVTDVVEQPAVLLVLYSEDLDVLERGEGLDRFCEDLCILLGLDYLPLLSHFRGESLYAERPYTVW